jgi:signal transduction histidine kinase
MLHVERLQQGLDQVKTVADQTDRLAVLGTMAASIAHEINNILTPVKAYAELALSSPGDTGLVRKALERAAQGVDRATRIAEVILACSKGGEDKTVSERSLKLAVATPVAAGGGEVSETADAAVETARTDVGDVVRKAVGALPPDPGQMWAVALRLERSLFAAIDAVALEQVLVNLLLNARTAMADGGLTTVRTRKAGARKDAVGTGNKTVSTGILIEVEDIGCGIPAERLASMFEPFVSFEGDSAAAAEQKSGGVRSGLGLTISRQLVDAAGGKIEAESEVGKGTRVRITLPAAAERRARKDAA